MNSLRLSTPASALFLALAASLCLLPGCAASKKSKPEKPAETLYFDTASSAFKHPKTGHVFMLHLGEELNHDTGGISEVPPNIKAGSRDATASYYEPTDQGGSGYACAESLYTEDIHDIVSRNTSIQYQADSGRLLITEDKSDGLPCRRYILFTEREHGGYEVSYLSPPYTPVMAAPGLPSSPPDIKLLPNDRAEIAGQIYQIKDITQSSKPFSVGG